VHCSATYPITPPHFYTYTTPLPPHPHHPHPVPATDAAGATRMPWRVVYQRVGLPYSCDAFRAWRHYSIHLFIYPPALKDDFPLRRFFRTNMGSLRILSQTRTALRTFHLRHTAATLRAHIFYAHTHRWPVHFTENSAKQFGSDEHSIRHTTRAKNYYLLRCRDTTCLPAPKRDALQDTSTVLFTSLRLGYGGRTRLLA